MRPYRQTFVTRHCEMDVDHLLRVQCLCNYMEEAAGNHAGQLGVGIGPLGGLGLAWVLVKLRLELMRRPGPDEELVVETWPASVERAQFRRDFIIYGPDGEKTATAVTQWVVMDVNTRKLERLPVDMADFTPENPPLAQPDGNIRLPAPADSTPDGPFFPVRLADIDQNKHVNNGRYIDFALEAADLAARADGLEPEADLTLCRLEVIFRAEGKRGDVIMAKTLHEDTGTPSYLHSLRREKDGQELARCRTVFTLRQRHITLGAPL